MEGSPVPLSADPDGNCIILFIRSWGAFLSVSFLQLGVIIPVHLLHVFVGSLHLNFLPTLSLGLDKDILLSFILYRWV